MTAKSLLCAVMLVPAALALEETKPSSALRAWYQDGTCLEFASESTGGTNPNSTSGSVLVGPTNVVRRVVKDRLGNVLFAYDVVAFHGSAPGIYEIQVRPTRHGDPYVIGPGDQLFVSVYGTPSAARPSVDADGKIHVQPFGDFRAQWLTPAQLAADIRRAARSEVAVSVARIAPTVSAARLFHDVHRGEAVKVDILQNSATGETISDILRPSDEPLPVGQAAAPVTDELVLGSFQITINGERFTERDSALLIGSAARIYVPGHGTYYLSLSPAPGFTEVGHASRERLSFSLAGQYVEIAADRNVLTKSAYRPVWVKHDTAVTPPRATGIAVITADNVESLLPGKRER